MTTLKGDNMKDDGAVPRSVVLEPGKDNAGRECEFATYRYGPVVTKINFVKDRIIDRDLLLQILEAHLDGWVETVLVNAEPGIGNWREWWDGLHTALQEQGAYQVWIESVPAGDPLQAWLKSNS